MSETYIYGYRYFPQFYWSVDYWCELYIGTIEVPVELSYIVPAEQLTYKVPAEQLDYIVPKD